MPVGLGTLGVALLEDCSAIPLERQRLEAAKKVSRWIAAGAGGLFELDEETGGRVPVQCIAAASCTPTPDCVVDGFPTSCGTDNCDPKYTEQDVENGCPLAP